MDFLKASFHRIRAFFAIPARRKYFCIISIAFLVLAAVPFTMRALQERSSYLPVYTPIYPQTPPPAFVGFTQFDRAVESLDSAVAGADRLVKLTILREMQVEEYSKIPGMFLSTAELPKDENGRAQSRIDGYLCAILTSIFPTEEMQMYTLFEAAITYDYETEKEAKEKIVIFYGGTHQYQEAGCPIYQPGDQHVMLLQKMWNPEGPLYATRAIFDIQTTKDGEYLLKRFDAYSEVPSLTMAADDSSRITSTKENPAKYYQKCKPEDLVAAVKQKLKEQNKTELINEKRLTPS